MKTEIERVPADVVGGNKHQTNVYRVRNYRLRDSLEQASRLLMFMTECDSNNTNAAIIPSDARKILRQWKIIQDEFQFALQFNDFPKGDHEYAFEIDLISGPQIQKVRNVPIKMVVTEIFNALRVMLSIDTASTQGYVNQEDSESILRIFEIVQAKMDRWLGDGSLENTGVNAPSFTELGQIVPDVDGDYARVVEPSPGMPLPKLDDTPDLPA